MTDTNNETGLTAEEQAQLDAIAAEQAKQEAAARAADDAAAQAEANEKAQAEGFADAKAKADAEAAAAKAKKPRKPRETKPKSRSVPAAAALGLEAAMERVAAGSHGGFAVRFGDDNGPIADIPPCPAPGCMIQRGRVVTGDRLVMRTRDLHRRVYVTHAWLFDGEDLLIVRELAAPVSIAQGEQFVIEPGKFAFF